MAIRYVQRIKRAQGKVDLYFRLGDFRERLFSPDNTQELQDEVDAILKRLERARAAARGPRAGTVDGMLLKYAGDGDRNKPCAEFLMLAASTQGEYLRMATELREDCAGVRLEEVTTAWLLGLRDAWALRGYKAANDRMQVLKNALWPAIVDERIQADPFGRIEKLRPPHDRDEAHPAWRDEEIEAALEWCVARQQPGLARAIGLGRWAGFRRGTICRIPVGARIVVADMQGSPERRLYWLTEKRRVICDKREDPRLTALIARTPNKTTQIAYNADGAPWKERQLNQAMTRMIDDLAKKGTLRPDLTIHGLRHARGLELVYTGASDAEIMSQLEQRTDRAAKIYRRQAERRRLADAAQDRIDKVVQLRIVAKQSQSGK